MEAKNILDYNYEFYGLCVKENLTNKGYDDFNVLEMFEGDPDIIHINGQIGFFFYHTDTNTVWYYFEESDENVDKILLAFFKKRLGKEYWDEKFQTWDYFNHHNAIAYRGGCGYSYSIFPLRISN